MSFDRGSCWRSVPLSEALLLENIKSDYAMFSDSVVAYGYRCTQADDPK